MSKRSGVVCFLLLCVAFLIVNRAAYKGYFQADEFDTLSWTQFGSAGEYLTAAISPRFSIVNFRPTAHFYFHEAFRYFGLVFPKYVLVLHLIHLLNVWLIWLLARRLGASQAAAALACLFFAFHMALFDAMWKPMYIFDVLCATFCLLSVLLYARGWWILSFASYWLGYKSKELAVMLPVVLACYEVWFGKRRWKPLLPFFLASLSFGLQGLWLNPNKDNEYTFRFTLPALGASSAFYAERVLLVPYLGFLVPLAAVLARNRRTFFGLAFMASLFFPLFFLPGRLLSAYCYAPFAGLAIVLAGIVETTGALPVALLLLLWLPLDLRELRAQRSQTLARDNEVHRWADGLRRFASTSPKFDAVAWAGGIPGFAAWGVNGAIGVAFRNNALQVAHFDGPDPAEISHSRRVAYLLWNRIELSTALRTPESKDCSYLRMTQAAGLWQLGLGWNDVDGDHRWTSPLAGARLERPVGASRFVLHLIVPWDQVSAVGPVTVRLRLGDADLGERRFDRGGDAEALWDLAPGPAGSTPVSIVTDPVYNGLGIAVRDFGFR